MNEVTKIMFSLGFAANDPHKQSEIHGYVKEAEEFMLSVGVKKEKITTQLAYSVKHLWADARNRGNTSGLIVKDGMVVHLIAQLRR